MSYNSNWKFPLFKLLAGIIFFACNESGLKKTNDFDQKPLLENIGNNLILPAYESLTQENKILAESIVELKNAPSADLLSAAQIQLKKARMAWQRCTPYQFGPAEDFGLSAEINIYPIDIDQIENNISTGSYDLSTLTNTDTKGYQTIGYLLFGDPELEQDILGSLSSDRLSYLEEVSSRIYNTSLKVNNAWKETQGNYLATFTSESSLGVDLGSSIGQLVNSMNRDFERNTRDGKIGIPVGIRTLGEPIPKSSEAYYGAYSIELLEENIAGYKDLFTGVQGIGFDDYLDGIQAATTGNEELTLAIIDQFEQIELAIDQIEDPLPMAIMNQKSAVEQVFAEIQIMVALFKVDMASSIGVVISYQDNDGD